MVLTLLRWSAQVLLAPRLKASIGITTAGLLSRPRSGVERVGPHSAMSTRARRVRLGRTAVPRSTPRPSSQSGCPCTIGARQRQSGCHAACGDGSRHRRCRQIDATSWSCIRFSVRCSPVGVHPLSFLNDLIRPSTLPNPRYFEPSCRLRGCPHHPSDRGSPPRLRASVERASWPSFLVFSRGDGPFG